MKDLGDWTKNLSDDDLMFLKRFVLFSGSLKELATAYDISYPTVRLRLDRLIEKIKVWDSQDMKSDFERALLVEYAEGRITMDTLKSLLAAYRVEKAKST